MSKLINTKAFLTTRLYFEENEVYTKAVVGTFQYKEFWEEQRRLCLEGLEIDGLYIPGTYYFYLNFFPIAGKDKNTNRKTKIFPKFTDADLEYFLIIERARVEKKGVIMTKPRRTGFSYKNAAIIVHEYNFYKNAKCVIGAFESKLADNTMNMCLDGLNFLDQNTVWFKPRNPDTRDFVKARHQKTTAGKTTWAGYNSEIRKLTFKDNPFSSVGLSANIFIFEEAGLFGNILESYNISEPTWKDGEDMVGLPILFGTAGDMNANSQQFAEMFYNPEKFNLLAFDNVWDKSKVGTKCGWFLPATRQRFGSFKDPETGKMTPLIDDDGNSNELLAIQSILAFRETKKGNPKAYRDSITQYPLTTEEAFLITGNNMFPVMYAQERLAELETNNLILNSYWAVKLIYSNEKVSFALGNPDNVIRDFPIKDNKGYPGEIEIFEQPYDDVPAFGVYIAGIDPYDDDASGTNSLGSCIVMNTLTGRIVAEYTGRPDTAKEYYEVCRRLLIYYNAICNYENAKKGLYGYFEQRNALHILCDTPKILKDQQITKLNYATGNNSKGTPATEHVNRWARELIKSWMLEQAVGKEDGVTNTHTIGSPAMLKEIIYWNKEGNFDRISALGMCLILREDRFKITYEEEEEDLQSKLDFFTRNYEGKARGFSYTGDKNNF